MSAIETYVRRFYRRDAAGVIGTIEVVRDGRTLSFANLAELQVILETGASSGAAGAKPSADPPERP